MNRPCRGQLSIYFPQCFRHNRGTARASWSAGLSERVGRSELVTIYRQTAKLKSISNRTGSQRTEASAGGGGWARGHLPLWKKEKRCIILDDLQTWLLPKPGWHNSMRAPFQSHWAIRTLPSITASVRETWCVFSGSLSSQVTVTGSKQQDFDFHLKCNWKKNEMKDVWAFSIWLTNHQWGHSWEVKGLHVKL